MLPSSGDISHTTVKDDKLTYVQCEPNEMPMWFVTFCRFAFYFSGSRMCRSSTCWHTLDTSCLERVPAMYGLLEMEELAAHFSSDQDELASEWTRSS